MRIPKNAPEHTNHQENLTRNLMRRIKFNTQVPAVPPNVRADTAREKKNPPESRVRLARFL